MSKTTRGYRAGPCLAAVVLLLSFVLSGEDGHSAGISPNWLKGFPVRVGTSVILMWSPVPGAAAYRLYRKDGAGEFREVYKGPSTNFRDTAPSSAHLAYRVTAVAPQGEETGPSPQADLKGEEPLPPPRIIGAIPADESVALRWTLPLGAAFTKVYRSETEEGQYVFLESVQGEAYSDRKVVKGKQYYYKVSAVDMSNRESVKSLSARTLIAAKAVPGATEKPNVVKVLPAGEFFGEKFYELKQPSELGFTREGELFVLERKQIQIFDHDGTYLRRTRLAPEWGLAAGVALDRDGEFLLPFYSDEVVRKIDKSGKLLAVIRYPPYDEKKRNNPNSIAVDGDGYYWIVDGVRSQVIKTDGSGEALKIIGRVTGTYDKQDRKESDLPGANRIYFNPYDGNLYVTLGPTAQVKRIDPKSGNVVRTFGGAGMGISRFQGIGGLAFRKSGNILVLDHLLQVVKEFTNDFVYRATYVDIVEKDRIKLSSNFITTFGFVEKGKRIFVTSSLGNRVYKFDLPE